MPAHREFPRSAWKRDGPPLVLAVAAMVGLVAIFPSALRVPHEDPTPVLEYAPVPPTEDDSPDAPPGDVGDLGLGQTGTLVEGIDRAPPPPPAGEVARPVTKECVGDPPRQTEDPMAPPCVPFFEGDNFGATWQGVTADEIRVVVYFETGSYNWEPSPGPGTYVDLSDPPQRPCKRGEDPERTACDMLVVRITRAMQRHFNHRFQTYNREVRFWLYFGNNSTSPAGRRADAVDNRDRIRPFAALDQAVFGGYNQDYMGALAVRGVMAFTSETALSNEFYRGHPGMSWGFWPDVERWAELYTSYVCTKVAPHPVRRAGNPPGTSPAVGSERVFGLYYTTDRAEPGLRHFREVVKEGLRDCGVAWVAEGGFPRNGFAADARDRGEAQAHAVAKFREEGVTTVLWLGGMEGKFTAIADAQGYHPEIVVAGDLNVDNNVAARYQHPSVWQNAWAVQFQMRMDGAETTPGFRAYRDAYPDAPVEEARYANWLYRDHFMLFQAIQVAGPRLTPESIERGFRAIPPRDSASPYVASCYFEPGDYSCVKDATEVWWDPAGRSPGDGQLGCWRIVRGGKRYRAWTWEGDDDVFRDSSDPCNGFDQARRLRL